MTITWLLCRSAEGAMVSGPCVCPLLSKGSVCSVFWVGVENLLKVPAWARRRGEIAIGLAVSFFRRNSATNRGRYIALVQFSTTTPIKKIYPPILYLGEIPSCNMIGENFRQIRT